MRTPRHGAEFLVRTTVTHLRHRGRHTWAGTDVSASRLEEFVKAEAHYFAQQRSQQALEPLTFPQLVSQSSSPQALEGLLQRELPIRFAARSSHIKKIQQWKQIPELEELERMHATSFRELRLAKVREEATLLEVVQTIRQRHKRIVPLFAKAVSTMHCMLPKLEAATSLNMVASATVQHEKMDFQALDRWANSFLASRISTEVMMTHYLATDETGCIEDSTNSGVLGILHKSCDPYDVCVQAAEIHMSSGLDKCTICVKEPRKPIRLCHTPRYLFYIVSELLANSTKATLRHCEESQYDVESRHINITVCADEQDVVIRICDQGGGFTSGNAENRFSYSFHIPSGGHAEAPLAIPAEGSMAEADLQPWVAEFSPLAGRGVGLPMCQMYVQYLGGSLAVMNLPGEGVDTYIMLKRIELS